MQRLKSQFGGENEGAKNDSPHQRGKRDPFKRRAHATLAYDAIGNISVKAQDNAGAMTMSYDAASRLTSMLQGGATTHYSYDANGNQTMDNNTGVITGYVYNNENKLTKQTNPDGTVSSYTYDGDGIRRTRQEPDGVIHTQIWDRSDYLGEL